MGSIAQEPQAVTKSTFPAEALTLEYAQSLDAKDPLRSFRSKVTIPSKANIKSTKVVKPGSPPQNLPRNVT
jgi:kynureninase